MRLPRVIMIDFLHKDRTITGCYYSILLIILRERDKTRKFVQRCFALAGKCPYTQIVHCYAHNS